MLKMRLLQMFFRGTWSKVLEQLFSQTFSDVCEAKAGVTYLVVFFNPLMLVVTEGHTYLNKSGSLS